MKYACQYAIVRFLPYPETGEFANVGIVFTCPQTGYFDFKLTKHRHRINEFFEELDTSIFINVKESFTTELKRLRQELEITSGDGVASQQALTRHLFTELVKPREAIIRFDEPRAVLAEDPHKTMNELYEHYIEHNFVTKQYQEKLIEQYVKQVLVQADLMKIYVQYKLSNPVYHVNFPFVKVVNNSATRIIKPLYLAQEDTTRLYNHGLEWVIKIRKLKKEKLLPAPDAVLFAVDSPEENKSKQFDTYNQVIDELKKEDVVVIDYGDKENLLKFASEVMG